MSSTFSVLLFGGREIRRPLSVEQLSHMHAAAPGLVLRLDVLRDCAVAVHPAHVTLRFGFLYTREMLKANLICFKFLSEIFRSNLLSEALKTTYFPK